MLLLILHSKLLLYFTCFFFLPWNSHFVIRRPSIIFLQIEALFMRSIFFNYRSVLNLVWTILIILCYFGLMKLFWMIFIYLLFVFFMFIDLFFCLIQDSVRFSIKRQFRSRLILAFFCFNLLFFVKLFIFSSILGFYLFTWWLQSLFRLFVFFLSFILIFFVNFLLMRFWTLSCWLFDILLFCISFDILRLYLGIWRNLTVLTWLGFAWFAWLLFNIF